MSISEVAAKSNGSLYTTLPPNVKGSGAGGNGGAVTRTSGSSLLDGVAVSRYNAGVFGSTVINGNDTNAVVETTFAKNTQRPLGKVLTQTVASQPALTRSIHKIEVYRTRKLTSALRENKWNEVTGEFEAGYPLNVVDTVATDNAANPSRTSPGSLVYKTAAKQPVEDNYKEKTG